MNLRLESLISAFLIALVGVVCVDMPSAQAALTCETAFEDKATLRARLDLKLEEQLHESRWAVVLDSSGEKQFDPKSKHSIRETATAALDFLESLGVEAKLTTFDEVDAVEFSAHAKSKSGWNRMAASLLKNYDVKLVYAPHYLRYMNSIALWQKSSRTLLVSRDSLRVGRGHRDNLQELGHMKSDLTKENHPNVFSGFISVLDESQRLVPNAKDYGLDMELDEVVRLAQDFHHLGNEVVRNESSKTRDDFKFVATRGQEILAVAGANLALNRSILNAVTENEIGSGPLLIEDGTVDQLQAYVATFDGVQISIDEKANGTLHFTLQNDSVSSTLWIPSSQQWHQLLPRLQLNEPSSHAEFQLLFGKLVQDWEKGIKPSLKALQTASKAILDGAATMPAKELSEIARAPRRVVAPHLEKRTLERGRKLK